MIESEKPRILVTGAAGQLGIGYEQLKEKFPRLIYCAISGYGGKCNDLRDEIKKNITIVCVFAE